MLALVAPPRIILCSSPPPSISTGDGRKYEIGGGENESSIRRSSKPTTITSTSNPLVKHCVKLRQSSSYRRSCSSSLVVGLTPILEICRYQALKYDDPPLVDCLLLLDGADIPEGFNGLDNSFVHVSPNVMKKLSGMQSVDSTEGIAVVRMPTTFHDMDMDVNQEKEVPPIWFPFTHRILVLDGIQDPGNLGTLLRSALAFKWDGVFLLPGCCDPFNDKVLRAARGATFQIPLVSGKWFHLDSLRTKFQMKMLAGHPESYSEEGPRRSFSLSGELADSLAGKPLCLVLGSEGNGLSEQAMLSCELVSIPMAGLFESLNVSVAGGIFLYMLQPKHHK